MQQPSMQSPEHSEKNTEDHPGNQHGQKPKPEGSFGFNFLLAVLVLVVAGLFTLFFMDPPPESGTGHNRHVIAVLPFNNLGGDPGQDYFSDGISVELINDLSKISGLSVIARHSVFIHKHSPVDIKTVHDQLGADYVVEGSVRKRGNRIHIEARLIDIASNVNLQTEQFDGELAGLFAFQDAMTAKIIKALSIRLTGQDRSRLADRYSSNIEAYDELLHGWQSLWLSLHAGILDAREHFLKAIRLDKNYARAYANLALTYCYDHLHGWSRDDTAELKRADDYADKAIEINPDLPNAYWVKAYVDIYRRDYQQALQYARKAIESSPGFADAYALRAAALNYLGKSEAAENDMLTAMRLNPKYPVIYNVFNGEILFNKGDYPGAIRELTFALDTNPHREELHIWLASAYAQTGQIDKAHAQLDKLRMNRPEMSLSRMESVIPFSASEQRQAFIEGLQKADQVQAEPVSEKAPETPPESADGASVKSD